MDPPPAGAVSPPAQEKLAGLESLGTPPEPAMAAPSTLDNTSQAKRGDSSPRSNPGTGQFTQYAVQSGDTLMKIAFETYGDVYQWRKIYEDNRDRIKDPNRVPSGTQLKLDQPSGTVSISRNGDKYQIQSGDTLAAIADNIYGKREKWKKIWENNKQLIKNPNRIFAGFYLYYTMTPEERNEAEQMKRVINKTPPLAKSQPSAPQSGNSVARAPASIVAPPSASPPAGKPPAPAMKPPGATK